ncbi:MAG: zinc ribbon domain-containing protein [Gammaproteobacteria bacterium]|nr:zinc ribbon domain-containing protein [Gammaproteobacteria bacterium]
MPIYEYQCTACQHTFDVLQKLSDAPLTYCPECGEARLRKLVSAPNFRLKGGGWYETDFKDKNKRNLAGDDSKAATAKAGDKAASGDTAKADAKSAGAAKSASDKPAAAPVAAKPKSGSD